MESFRAYSTVVVSVDANLGHTNFYSCPFPGMPIELSALDACSSRFYGIRFELPQVPPPVPIHQF